MSSAAARVWLLLLILLLAGYRLAVLSGMPLFFDESYYYYWSQHLDWGYFSKPPMVALLIRATTGLFGDGPLGLKMGALLCYTLTSGVIHAIASHLYDRRVAWWSALAFMCVPIVGFNSLFVSTDAPLLLFWSLTLYAFLRARDEAGWGWWLLAGLFAGLGLESKYTMGLLAPSLLLYLLWSGEHRRLLTDPRLWTAVGLAALLWLPNLYWNWQNDFISFRHTAEITQLDRELFHPDELAAFLGAQFIVFGPVLMAVLVGNLFRARSSAEGGGDARRFLLSVTLPTLLLFSLQALMARANFNWAAPAYVGAVVLVSAVLVRGSYLRWLMAGLVINLLLLGAIYHYHAVTALMGLEPSRKTDPYWRVLGWEELADELAPIADGYPDARLTSDSREVLAYMSYYLRRFELAAWNGTGQIRNQYELVADMQNWPDAPLLYVGKDPLSAERRGLFQEVRPLGEVAVPVYADMERRLFVYWLKGFKGYPQ